MVGITNHETWIWIANLPSISNNALKDAFKLYNPKRSKTLWRQNVFTGNAGIEFDSIQEAERACREMDGANINGREIQCKPAQQQDLQKILEKGKRKPSRGDHGFGDYSNPNNIPTANFILNNPNNSGPNSNNLQFSHSPIGGGLLPLPNTPPLIPFNNPPPPPHSLQTSGGLLQNPMHNPMQNPMQNSMQHSMQNPMQNPMQNSMQNPSIANINPNLNVNLNPNPNINSNSNPNININSNTNPNINPNIPKSNPPLQPNPPLLHQPNLNQANPNPPPITRPNSPPAPSLLQTPPMGSLGGGGGGGGGGGRGGLLDNAANNPLISLGNFFKSLNLSPDLPISKLPHNVLNNIPASLMSGISPNFTIGNFLQQLQQIQMLQQPSFVPPPVPRNIPTAPPLPQYPVGPPSIFTVPQADLKAALTSRQFYIIDFESSCVANTFPCEVAIVALTFSSQVAQNPDYCHRFIDSSPIPGCLISEALFAQATHGIPRAGFKEATKDYQKVLHDIQAFTNVQDPMFFAKGPKQSIKSLEWLAEKTGRKAVLSWQIKPIEELIEVIHKAYDRQISAASASNIFISDHSILQDYKCDQDKKYRCVLGDVRKMSLLLKSTIADVKQHSYSYAT